ncbi:MAG TPA: lipoate--protein ligase [Clostridiales bacterium]|nr:lipoate--protein ligase [Clostridiales bacterium]
MIRKIKYVITKETNPYKNLALEAYLLNTVEEDECILYLWQNERTVVIGKNQNPWRECKVAELEEAGGNLVRRLSGGGAVFHDLGNLNFTFLVTKNNYDVERQLQVILEAVRQRGIPAEKTGRNDISVEGKKFSGNAYFSDGLHCYHHGTILVKADMEMLSHYLNVSREKLVSKGVESVRSRVTNLTEYCPDLSIDMVRGDLVKAFQEVYGLVPEQVGPSELPIQELNKLEDKFSSWVWIYGKKINFNYCAGRRFPWGGVELAFEVESGIVKDCLVFSDSLETEIFERIADRLCGLKFSSHEMAEDLSQVPVQEGTAGILTDIIGFLREEKL